MASAPERRSRPKRSIMVIVAAFAGLFLAVLIAFARRAFRKVAEDPASAGQLDKLKAAWVWRL